MNIMEDAKKRYEASLAPPQDPLTILAQQIGLKVASPEAEQKLRLMGEAVASQAKQEGAMEAKKQEAEYDKKWRAQYKQSFFGGVKPFGQVQNG